MSMRRITRQRVSSTSTTTTAFFLQRIERRKRAAAATGGVAVVARHTLHTTARATTAYQLHPTVRNDQGQLLSRVSGDISTPLSRDTLGRWWRTQVADNGDQPALIVRHEPADQHASVNAILTRQRNDKEACIRWTFADMDQHVRQLVRGMRALGVERGDRVAVLMMNNSSMASLQIATAFIGAILVTLNPSYTAKDLKRALNHVEARYLFIVPSLRSSNYLDNLHAILPSLASKAGGGQEISDEECASLKRIVLVDNLTRRPGPRWSSESELGKSTPPACFDAALKRLNGHAIDYRALLNEHGEDGEEPGLTAEDIVNLQLTSGTTGAPKAVALSSRNLVNNGIMLGQLMHLTNNDILANIPPLFHCFGLTLGNLAAWSAGACILYPSEGFNPVRALRASAEEKATAIHGVPAHFIAELDILRRVRKAEQTGKWDAELTTKHGIAQDERWQFALRTGFTSGSTVPIELMHAIMDDNLLGAHEQTVVYGMTETSPVSFGCDTAADVPLRCETVGRVMPHVHAKIVDPDDHDGAPLPIGEVGELCSAGYVVMQGGYWNDKARTDEVLQRHPDEPELVWMRTGDLGVMDEHGYTSIRGRVKDMIIRGGENLTATGIENCIDTLDGVAASAVVAVPDKAMGEAVGVFISLLSGSDAHLTPAGVRAYVKEHMSGQCAPDWVWFMGQDGVPTEMATTASGKVQKNVLRQWARDFAGQGVGRVKKEASK